MSDRILVLSPHPDDEAIGLGGTLRLHVERGDEVQVIFLTSGEKGVRGQDPNETARIREAEATAAAGILGYSAFEFWRQPDGSVEATPALIRRLKEKFESWQPSLVYVPHSGEQHPDHQAAALLVKRAVAESQGGQPEVRHYEVWTPLQQMDYVEDVSAVIEVKLAAIRAHQSQCQIMRFDEAALGLARYRGEMHSWPGGPYAEVFSRA